MIKQALLIIDVQNNMFAPPTPVANHESLLVNLQTLLERARAATIPIVYVQHCGEKGDVDEPGTNGWEIHPAIAPQTEDIIVQKRMPDSFYETLLRAELDALGIETLVIAGLQTEYCVDATVRRACSEQYDVILVGDAHSTWPSGGLSAQQIVDHHNRVLGDWFATLRMTAEVGFGRGE